MATGRTTPTGHFLIGQLARLTRAGIAVFAISGNHDAQSVLTRQLPWPERARLFGTDKPGSLAVPGLPVVIHGQGFATRAVTDNLALHYPAPEPGKLNIGLLHTAAGDGAHENYAPCTVEQLVAHGYQYWALGHVHLRAHLAGHPSWVVFPGVLQGRHINEEGPKGATLVRVAAGRMMPEHRALDVVRWARVAVDLTGAETAEATGAAIRAALIGAADAAEGRLLAARVELRGATRRHAALARDPAATAEDIRAELVNAGLQDHVWIEKVAVLTRPAVALDEWRAGSDAHAVLLRSVEAEPTAEVAAATRAYAAPHAGPHGQTARRPPARPSRPARRRRRHPAGAGGARPQSGAVPPGRGLMRLRHLGLEAYGNFAKRSLDLDDRPGVLNLIVAPNGFGKSVLRRAVSELLFGIHPQTPMGFQFGYDRMRLVTTAVFPDTPAIAFARRKGRSNTLTDAEGKPAPASLPALLPREAERKRLERLFVLDSAALREGGKALLQTDGDLADALLSSAGDLGSARKLAADFAERRDDAAPERRRASAPFYEAADEWTEAGKLLAATITRPAAVAEQEQARTAALQAREGANARAAAARGDLARLARIRTTRRHLADFDAATGWLDAHAHLPPLPPGAGAALDHAKAAAAGAERDAAEAAHRHAALAASRAGIAQDPAALAEAAAIERLTATLTQSATSRVDIPKRDAELATARATIARLLRELSAECDPDDAVAAVRPTADIAAARALIAAHAGLSTAVTTARHDASRSAAQGGAGGGRFGCAPARCRYRGAGSRPRRRPRRR